MNTRIRISVLFFLLSMGCLWLVYFGHLSTETSGILANLGTGFIGTVLTVLIVDWLYERRSSSERGRSFALSVILELDHAVWVWQGGKRSFDVDELYTLIHNAEESDPVPPYTQNLFMRLGTRCASYIKLNTEDLARNKPLEDSLAKIAQLEGIRDGQFKFELLRGILLDGIGPLLNSCGLAKPTMIDLPLTAHRTTSEEHQHFRHYGRQVDGTAPPLWYPAQYFDNQKSQGGAGSQLGIQRKRRFGLNKNTRRRLKRAVR